MYMDAPDSVYKMQCCVMQSFSPLFGTFGTLRIVRGQTIKLEKERTDLVEGRHGLVGATDLQLIPVCLVVPALLVRTLY